MIHAAKMTVILLAVGLTDSALAAGRIWTVAGENLKILSPCAETVTIEPAADLHGRIKVTASARHQEEIDQLRIVGGPSVLVDKIGSRCLSSNSPSLTLVLEVPVKTAIDIAEHGSTNYHLGDIGGTLQLALGGSGDVEASHSSNLSIVSSGSGDVEVAAIDGAVEGKLSGSGNLSLGKTLPGANGLQFVSTGSGNITIRQANGPLQAKLSGSGNLTVNEIETAKVDLATTGSSSIHLANGSIADLSIAASGSSDITVDAQVVNAALNITGSSDVSLPSVSGHVTQNHSGSGHLQIGKP
jgi:hypothetical protein